MCVWVRERERERQREGWGERENKSDCNHQFTDAYCAKIEFMQ